MKINVLILFLLCTVCSYAQKQVLTGYGLQIEQTTEVKVKAGSTGKLSLDDTTKLFLFLAEAKGLTLEYKVTGGEAPPVPTVTVPGTNSGNGGTYNYPVLLSGQKNLVINYALAPGGPAANATLSFKGVRIWSGVLTPTAGWNDYRAFNTGIEAQSGLGALTMTVNRGINIRSYVFTP